MNVAFTSYERIGGAAGSTTRATKVTQETQETQKMQEMQETQETPLWRSAADQCDHGPLGP